MRSPEAIDEFLKGVSWGEQTTRIEVGDGRQRLAVLDDEGGHPTCILIPTHFSQVRQRLSEALFRAVEQGCKAGFILHGDAGKAAAQALTLSLLTLGFAVHWLGAENQVAAYQVLDSLLPIDWPKQFQDDG